MTSVSHSQVSMEILDWTTHPLQCRQVGVGVMDISPPPELSNTMTEAERVLSLFDEERRAVDAEKW